MKRTVSALFVAVGIVAFFLPNSARAQEFDMNFIITDDQFTDANSMSAEKIQEFLNLQSGILDTYSMTTADGTVKTAAQIIYQAAQANRISPRVLLTTIQKESSMLTRNTFGSKGQQYYLDWVNFYGWCDSCTTGTNRGFENQMNAAAGAYRRYLNSIAQYGYTVSYWGPGIAKKLTCISSDASRGLCTSGSTITITPVNAATSALFTYTPHPGGNYSFWTIWNQYGFGTHLTYPDGSILQPAGTRDIYIIENGVKRRFVSMSVFLSRYSPTNIITVSKDQLFFYDNGASIKYANFTLLKAPSGGIFLLVNGVVRPITSRAAFKAAGFQNDTIVKASWADINQFPHGTAITPNNVYPSGQLLKDKKTGGVYYVMDGIKHGIPSREIYTSQFGKRRSIPVKSSQLAKYPLGNAVGFKDGELVTLKTGGPVYFVSNGLLRQIVDQATADAYKFNLTKAIKTNQRSLDMHQIGDPLTITPPAAVQSASQ